MVTFRALLPSGADNPHPPCPTCQTAEDVCRRTRVEMDEFHWLDAEGDVISAFDADEHHETGYAWYCSACGNEWDHDGSLASNAPTPSYVGHAVYAAELRAAETFCLELRKFQPLWVDSARRYMYQRVSVQWTAIELAEVLRWGLSQLPESHDGADWPLPDWRQR